MSQTADCLSARCNQPMDITFSKLTFDKQLPCRYTFPFHVLFPLDGVTTLLEDDFLMQA